MNCPIEPSENRVVLLPDTTEEQTAGGIYIPEVAKENQKTATVLAIGPKCEFYQPGDHVLHTKYAGTEVELDRVTYLTVREDELIGRIPAKVAVESSAPAADPEDSEDR